MDNYLIIDDQKIPVPFECVNWRTDPVLAPPVTDFNVRRTWVRSIVLHTVHGRKGPLRPGMRSSTRAEVYARYQTRTARRVSWHFTVDTDGTVIQQSDPARQECWHATRWNPYSVGIEMVQDEDGSLYVGEQLVVVQLIDVLTRELNRCKKGALQRQIPWTGTEVTKGVLPRADENGAENGRNLVGIFAHHHNTQSRGEGDCGKYIFDALSDAGYERMDFNLNADKNLWTVRQRGAGIALKECDGIPGPKTRDALEAAGQKYGLWIDRPGD